MEGAYSNRSNPDGMTSIPVASIKSRISNKDETAVEFFNGFLMMI